MRHPFNIFGFKMAKKYTQEDFERKIKEVHGDNIDISKFKYDGNNVKGVCKCNTCGCEWHTIPMSLFNGHGCPKCAIKYKAKKLAKTTDTVIKEFKKIHGNRYIYTNVKYENERKEVEIICKEHGSFMQRPFAHLLGRGCPKCAKSGIKLSNEEFKKRISERFESIDLSEYKYVNSSTFSKCKCKVCGNEWTSNYKTLLNSTIGCPECAKKSRREKRAETLDGFIIKLKEKYPTIDYDFSESIYINALSKMNVICPRHGIFEIKPNDLMSGHGCPRCNDSRLEKEVRIALIDNGLEFEQNKRYSWLLNESTNAPLSLDFYLPNEKIAIECQGEQHFIPIEHFGGEDGMESRKYRDDLKKKLCEESGVKLIYYLDEQYNGFLNVDDIYFNGIQKMIEWIKGGLDYGDVKES